MPPTDYGAQLASAVAVVGFRGHLRAFWMKLRHRGQTVDGYRVEGLK